MVANHYRLSHAKVWTEIIFGRDGIECFGMRYSRIYEKGR